MKKVLLFVVLTAFTPLLKAATFTSAATGNWATPATWTFIGSDADGVPDNTDDVIITTGKNISITNNQSCKNFTINPGGIFTFGGSWSILVWGSLTQNGTTSGSGTWQFRAVGTYSGNTISNNGLVYFYANYTIAAGVVCSKLGQAIVSNGVTVTNNGSFTLNNSSLNLLGSTAKWVNAAGSNLVLSSNVTGTGKIDATAASNTVTYQKTYTTIYTATGSQYYNLVLNTTPAGTKSQVGQLTVLNNLTINAGVTLNCANKNIVLGGNWINNANTTCTNMATVNFNGSGVQTITRTSAENFNNINLAGTGTVQLGQDINVAGNLTVTTGTLDVSASNFDINVAGTFRVDGSFNARSGVVTLNGGAAQNINGFSIITFYDLTSANTLGGVTVNTTIVINNVLTVNNTSFNANTFGNGYVVIPATGSTTYGRIGVVGAAASLTGTGWYVQSFINGPATAYWQYLASPMNGNTLADWDNDARFYMSAVGGNDGTACCPTFYSVRTYNEGSNTYTNVTSLIGLTKGKGYMVWMADNLVQLNSPLVYDNVGTPSFGNVTFPITAGGAGGGYNLVGNPYACPLTYASVVAASGNLGPNFVILQENGTYTTNPNGGTIAPNQGFLCVATSSGNISFTEACKSTVANPNIIRTASPENMVRIRTTNEVNGLGGETTLLFQSDAHNGFDLGPDMMYLPSPYEDATNIFTTDLDSKDLLCNALNSNEDKLAIPITVIANSIGGQTISFVGINRVVDYSCAWLENVTTGEKIDLSKTDFYTFSSEAIGAKYEFILHFEKSSTCPLAEQNLTQSLDAMSQVYANNGQLMAKFYFTEKTDVTVSIFDVEGREVVSPMNFSVSGESVALETPASHGVYLVRITSGNNTITKKIYN